MKLSAADAIYVGGSLVDRVMCNGAQLWPLLTGVPDFLTAEDGSRTSQDNATFTLASAPKAGNLIFPMVGNANNLIDPMTWPDGYAQIEHLFEASLTDGTWWAYHECDGTETDTIHVSFGGFSDYLAYCVIVDCSAGAMYAHSGHARTAAFYNSGTTVLLTGDPIVVENDGDLIIWMAAMPNAGGETPPVTITPPADFLEIGRLTDTYGQFMYAAFKVEPTAGTYTYSGSYVAAESNSMSQLVTTVALTGVVPSGPVPMRLTGLLPTTATVGVPYSGALTITGTRTDPVTIDASAGTIPSWMAVDVDAPDVHVSGTPDTDDDVAFTPRATDSTSPTAQVAIGPAQTIAVAPADEGGGDFTPATWDATRKGTSCTLSGGDLIASFTSQGIVIALNPKLATTAHFYWETGLADETGETALGVASDTADGTNDSQFIGAVDGTFAAWSDTSTNNATEGNTEGGTPGWGGGDVMKECLLNGSYYIGKVGHGWWNSAANDWTGDPETGVGAILTGLTGNYSPVAGVYSGNSCVWTANYGGASFAETPPAGCTGWPLS